MTADIELAFRYSRYAANLVRRDPALVDRVRQSSHERPALNGWRTELADASAHDIDARLRAMRRELMLRTVVRDLVYETDFTELVIDLTAFADLSVNAALRAHTREHLLESVAESGQPSAFGLSVVAMGKMGGGELNASSDIDIVFVCDEPPATSMESLNRVAQAVTRSIDRAIDGDFVFRVDTRLRPYGNAGPIVSTLDFLEHYFVTQGRMWERLAWLRSRVAAGPLDEALQSLVTPFVFRRYLDFDAITGMRELHAQLRAEKNDPRNVKLGRGGIRELEFGVQLRQLLRGGRDARMRVKNTLTALSALAAGGYISKNEAETLGGHYRFLRRLEHVLQYRDDLQTQTLPSAPAELDALAEALRFASASALDDHITSVRNEVAAFFDGTLGGVSEPSAATSAAPIAASALGPLSGEPSGGSNDDRFHGYTDPANAARFLDATVNSVRAKSLPTISRERLVRLTEMAIDLARTVSAPDAAFTRTLDLLATIASRSSYLALMTERPNVLRRVVDLAATSEWAVRYLATHPLLLDELIDARSLSDAIDYTAWHRELTRMLEADYGNKHVAGDDTEAAMDALRHFQQAETFRLLLKDIAGQFTVETLSDHLSALADVCVDATLRKLLAASRLPMQATLAVIAYGKWGSKELGYSSDLDLIFLMPDEAVEYRDQLTRAAQKLQNWLTTLTAAGRAYEIDVRLRPDGVSGLLLSTVSAFETYQLEKAWTWEHQALTRARFAAGNRALGHAFERIRESILAMPRDWPTLRSEIVEMRERIAKEHPNRDRETLFDVKHDPGGLVDMEFAVQALVLRYAHEHPELRPDHGNIALAQRAATLGLLGADGESIARDAADAYRALRKTQHALRLSGADKARVPREDAVAMSAAVLAFSWRAFA